MDTVDNLILSWKDGELSNGEVLCALSQWSVIVLDAIAGVALEIKRVETEEAERNLPR